MQYEGVRQTRSARKEWTRRTFVFWMIRCRGESTRATREVEKSISMMETLPSSLLKILEKGSV